MTEVAAAVNVAADGAQEYGQINKNFYIISKFFTSASAF